MAKQCVVCKKDLGILTGKLKISDGYICSKCWEKAGFDTSLSDITNAIQYSSNTLNDMIRSKNENEIAINNFAATKKVGNIMQFSDDSQTFVITTQKGFKKITSQTKTSGIIYKKHIKQLKMLYQHYK